MERVVSALNNKSPRARISESRQSPGSGYAKAGESLAELVRMSRSPGYLAPKNYSTTATYALATDTKVGRFPSETLLH